MDIVFNANLAVSSFEKVYILKAADSAAPLPYKGTVTLVDFEADYMPTVADYKSQAKLKQRFHSVFVTLY